MPRVTVEFFGIPRARVSVACYQLDADTLGDAVLKLQQRFPHLSGECLNDGLLSSGYLMAINAQLFTRDPLWKLAPGDTLQLMSADVGG